MKTDLPTLDRVFFGIFLVVCVGLAVYSAIRGEYALAVALGLGAGASGAGLKGRAR